MNPEPQGKVLIVRNSPLDIKIRGLDVLVDDKMRGNLQFGQELEVPLSPGTHNIRITNSLYSKNQDFSVSVGETVEFIVGNKRPNIIGALWMVIGIAPYKVILERVAS